MQKDPIRPTVEVVSTTRRIELKGEHGTRMFDIFYDEGGRAHKIVSLSESSEVVRCNMETLHTLWEYLTLEGTLPGE